MQELQGHTFAQYSWEVYGRIIIQRVINETEETVREEECICRRNRCADQIFILRQLSEKVHEKGKQLYWCVIDLENAYDTAAQNGVWEIMKLYGVRSHTL